MKGHRRRTGLRRGAPGYLRRVETGLGYALPSVRVAGPALSLRADREPAEPVGVPVTRGKAGCVVIGENLIRDFLLRRASEAQKEGIGLRDEPEESVAHPEPIIRVRGRAQRGAYNA